MSQPEDIPTRVGRLEQEMAEVRVLAVGADHDVSNMQDALRAHTGALNALRETQLDQGRELTTLRHTQLDHGSELTTLRETQLDQGRELTTLRHTQLDHGRLLTDHRRLLTDHGRLLTDHGRELTTLRDTQLDHGQRLDRLERKVDDGFKQVDANFSTVNTGIAHITALLTNKENEPKQE